jgi:transcriptional regulator with XRE-family HTH domain
MTARRSPTVQRRRLGSELRHLREQAGMTIEEVAAALECSHSKVSRIETGQVSATPRDVRDILDLYKVDPKERDALVQVARQARQRGWWQAYSDTLVVPLVGLESAADRIGQYQTMVIPGLLQTPDYARAVLRVGRPDLPPRQIERWVEFRMARQPILTRDHAPAFSVVLEECLLLRPVGGQRVMQEQLHRLAETAALPAMTLQVLPMTVGEHVGLSGPFTIYRFDSQEDPDVVYLEHPRDDLYLESPEQVEPYVQAFEQLQALALSPAESAARIARLARELK